MSKRAVQRAPLPELGSFQTVSARTGRMRMAKILVIVLSVIVAAGAVYSLMTTKKQDTDAAKVGTTASRPLATGDTGRAGK